MKTEGFVKLLRKVIREEVRNVINKELKPLLNETKIEKHDINLHEIADIPKRSTKPVAKKQYTKNPILNDLLNETATTPATQELTDWSTMNFKQEMAQSFGAERSHNMPVAPLATKGINGEVVDMNNEGVASAVNAMTKDYSALMKAIDKKKGK